MSLKFKFYSKKYDYLINKECTQLIKKELFLVLFLLVCFVLLSNAAFGCSMDHYYIFEIKISFYYLFPWVVVFFILSVLLFRFLKTYKRVVFNIDFYESKTLFCILGVKEVWSGRFEIILNKSKFGFKDVGHVESFKKYYYDCIGVRIDGRVYLIPVAEYERKNITKLLVENGGEVVD